MTQTKIAIQGVTASFHDIVARKYFGKDIETVPCETFKDLCETLVNRKVDYAVMAIENTIAGTLLQNYALLKEYHFNVIGEFYQKIQMNLMALPGVKTQDIEFVQSHPIALRQCAEYLYSLKNVKLLEKNDTADCARQIKEEGLKTTAAVASKEAAEAFGLEILEKGIETNKKNYTRFLILSDKPGEGIESNKASLAFELKNLSGSLAKVLTVFSEHTINLTKIQSIPILGKPYEYAFHIDVEWNKTEDYRNALQDVLKYVANLSVLGEYKKGEFDLNQNMAI